MDIPEPEQELSHLKLKQMGNVRYDPAIEEEEEDYNNGVLGSVSVESSFEEDSRDSSCLSSLSSLDVAEDDASSSSVSSSSSMVLSSNGPLYHLSELMSQLPIKRGLSKFYEGKSQSFTSLASVESIEDLVKKGCHQSSHGMRMKSCKSFGGPFEQTHKRAYSPKATISKKTTRTASAMSVLGRRTALLEETLSSQNPNLQTSSKQTPV